MVLDADLFLALMVTSPDVSGQMQFVTIRKTKSLPPER